MENFHVKRVDDGNITKLFVEGFLDAHTAPVLEKELQKSIEEECYKILVNFKDLNYISSAGLGVFMGFIEKVRSEGGDIKMCGMSDKIYRVFDLLGFPTLFDIVKDEETAIEKF
jgi:anti-sigma B factor antagonist